MLCRVSLSDGDDVVCKRREVMIHKKTTNSHVVFVGHSEVIVIYKSHSKSVLFMAGNTSPSPSPIACHNSHIIDMCTSCVVDH